MCVDESDLAYASGSDTLMYLLGLSRGLFGEKEQKAELLRESITY